MLEQLRALTCFSNIDTIAPITAGLSSQCYQVNADNKVFFVKNTTANETEVTLVAAEQGISPKVIYHDQHWLVSQFITGDNLAQSPQYNSEIISEKINKNLSKNIDENIDANIAIAIKLMTQCHQFNAKLNKLAANTLAQTLIKQKHFSIKQQAELAQVAGQLISPLNSTKGLVCCHGDVNFSNILIDQNKRTWLVDYECACLAPIEYDLAMFIAVNNLQKDKIPAIIEQYISEQSISEQDKKHSLVTIEPALLQHYLMFCYFINGLWYFNQYQNFNPNHNDDINKFLFLAKQQWQYIDKNIALIINSTT